METGEKQQSILYFKRSENFEEWIFLRFQLISYLNALEENVIK